MHYRGAERGGEVAALMIGPADPRGAAATASAAYGRVAPLTAPTSAPALPGPELDGRFWVFTDAEGGKFQTRWPPGPPVSGGRKGGGL
jgi:hypothetical protein